MIRPPPRSTRTDTLFPYTTLFRSTLPGGSSVTYGASTTVQMSTRPPIVRILDMLEHPNLLRRILFRLFGVKECSHYLTIQDGSPFRDRKSTRLNSSH